MRLAPFSILTFCLSAGMLTGQTPAGPPPVPDPVIHVSVNLVQVDTVVTDSRGKSVSDLRAEDFEILEDGRPQKITNFSWNHVALPSTPPVAAAANSAPNPSRGNVHRAIALVVDDSGRFAELDIIPIVTDLKKFVATEVGADDLVSVTASRGGMGFYQEFTNDKRQLNAAIDRILHRSGFGHWTVATPEMPNEDGVMVPIQLASDEPSYGYRGGSPPNPVGTLMAAIQSLQNLPGRKAIVLFSHSFAAPQGLTDLANRLGVVIYVIDPHGTDLASPVIPSNAPYRQLAKQTGGLWIKSGPGSDLTNALTQVLEDMSGYYLLGYQAARSDFELSNGRPLHHAIQVRVRRPGLTARARSGFAGVPDLVAGSAPRTREEYLRQALFSPFTATGIRLRLETAYRASLPEPPAKRRAALLHAIAAVEGHDLRFSDTNAGAKNLVFDVAVTVLNPDGTPAVTRDRRVSTTVSPAQAVQLAASGLALKMDLKLPRPGPFQIRAAVRDVGSGAVGNVYSFLEIPDFNRPGIVLSSIELSPADAEGSTGTREFAAGSRIHFDCDAFGLSAAPASEKDTIEMAIRLFQDGALVFDSQPFSAPSNMLAQHVLAGNIQLGGDLAPGDYEMQLAVRDGLAPRQKQTVSQWVGLAIVKTAPAALQP